MGTHNHQVRANVELLAPFRRFYPSAGVHVRNADPIDARRSAGQAVLYPMQKHRVEAPWLVVRIAWNTREAGPSVRAFTKNPVFGSRRRWSVEHRCIFGNECGSGAQRICDLLRVRHGKPI